MEQQEKQDLLSCFINMWAIVKKQDSRVCGIITPEIKEEDFKKFENDKDILLVPMNPDNSPSWIGALYKDGKFYE
jgi:SOS-response transcriptional repressor LexA